MNKPLMDFIERAQEMEADVADDPRLLAIYRRTIETTNPNAVWALQRKYADQFKDFNPNGEFKYGDIPFWIVHAARYAVMLDLDTRPPSVILDIGMGAGHFLAVAKALGHRCIGIDIDVPFYEDACAVFHLDRRMCSVMPYKKLPDFGMRFNIITAFWTCFNVNGYTAGGQVINWGKGEWEFFLCDIEDNHLKVPGVVLLDLNPEARADGTIGFNEPLLSWLRKGAAGEGGLVMLSPNADGKIVSRSRLTLEARQSRISDHFNAAAALGNGSIGSVVSIVDDVTRERQRIADALAGLDAERAKMAEELGELETTVRVLARFVEARSNERRPETAPVAERALISDSVQVPLDRFRHSGVSPSYWAAARDLEPGPIRVLGSFPIPGRQSPSGVDLIRFDTDEVKFPEIGEYYFYCDLGAFKVLILDKKTSDLDKALKIFSFAAKNIIHSGADAWMCVPDGYGGPFRWRNLAGKFFYSDQPLHLHCGHAAYFLAFLLWTNGLNCRCVNFSGKDSGHIVVEAWDPDTNHWVMLDPDWGLCISDGSGRLLSVEEIANRLKPPPRSCGSAQRAGGRRRSTANGAAKLQVVDLAGKCWNHTDFNLPFRFTGHITWDPSRQSDYKTADPDVYFAALRGCLGTMDYAAFDFDEVEGAMSWKPLETSSFPGEVPKIDWSRRAT